MIASGEFAIGSMARYLGLLAAGMGRYEEAERHFETAIERNAKMGARPWVARTQRDYAYMRLARDAPGDRDTAELLISQAASTYRELGVGESRSPLEEGLPTE